MNPHLDDDSTRAADHQDPHVSQPEHDSGERPPVEAFDPHFAKRPSDNGAAVSTYDPHFG